jgi:hypothetical protein
MLNNPAHNISIAYQFLSNAQILRRNFVILKLNTIFLNLVHNVGEVPLIVNQFLANAQNKENVM